MRKIILFLTILFFYLFPLSFINFNTYFLEENYFLLTFIIIYISNTILISLSTFKIIKDNILSDNYLFILIINYLIIPLFNLFFFNFKNIYLAFISLIIILITNIYLYLETKVIDKIASYYLVPYIAINVYFTLTIILLMFLNVF